MVYKGFASNPSLNRLYAAGPNENDMIHYPDLVPSDQAQPQARPTEPNQPSVIQRKPVQSFNQAAVASGVAPAAAVSVTNATAPTPTTTNAPSASQSIDLAPHNVTLEQPARAVLPADQDELVKKENDAPSLESGSIVPYTGAAAKPTMRQRFDAVFPPYKTYLGRFKRRTFLLFLLGLLLLLILIIGLAAGLSGKKNKVDNKPLPAGQIQTGELTYYDPGGPGFGSCGEIHYADDAICAVSHLVYDSVAKSANPNENELCGRMIRVSRVDERDGKRKSIDCKVVDRCEGCKAEDVDLSPGMYNKIAAEELGRVSGKWAWLD